MPLTPAQNKHIYENLMSWNDLHSNTQKRILFEHKKDVIHFLWEQDSFVVHPLEEKANLAGAIAKARKKAEANFTPWFFAEFFLEETVDGKSVSDILDEKILKECQETIYFSSVKMEQI